VGRWAAVLSVGLWLFPFTIFGDVMKTTSNIWLSNTSYLSPSRLLELTPEQLLNSVMIYNGDSMQELGYTKIGSAVVEIELFDQNTMIVNKIAVLQETMQVIKAESQKKLQEIETQIQNLLAIEE
jgi:hypothetical protein